MRVTIAGQFFYLLPNEVTRAMRGIAPEPVPSSSMSVGIGRRTYPVMQVGAMITGQDRRDFTAAEVTRALRLLGFACMPASASAAPGSSPHGASVTEGAAARVDAERPRGF